MTDDATRGPTPVALRRFVRRLVEGAHRPPLFDGQSLPVVQGVTGKRLLYTVESHLAWPSVQAQPSLLDDPIHDLKHLDEAVIRAAFAAVPGAWWNASERAPRALDDLIARRASVSDTLTALRKRLS